MQPLARAPQADILLGCVPALSPESVGKADGDAADVAMRKLEDMMAWMERAIPRFFGLNDDQILGCTVMACLEKHQNEGWHYHWAVKGLGRAQLSLSKFRELCLLLRGFFGKWSYAAFGRNWTKLQRYYLKNCEGQGSGDGIFASTDPSQTGLQALVLQEKDRANKKKLGTAERNQMVIKFYEAGKLQELVNDAEFAVPVKDLPKWVEGCRLLMQLTRLTRE